MNKNISSNWKLVISILLCEIIGISSGLFSAGAIKTWYLTLQKPAWNPPNYLFGPVWTILYVLMGISLWLIWKSNVSEAIQKKAIYFFALQLFINFWWSIVFFNFQSPALGLIVIILMLLCILLTIFQFAPISKTAAWLLVPYISWVSFATILNYTIWSLN
jgi:benzodiazapine receptor